MRILYLGNNWVGWQVLQWLKQQGEEIVGLVVHPPHRRKYGEEILQCVGLDPSCIFDGSQLGRGDVIGAIQQLKPEIGISALFGYILRPEFIEGMPYGCINIHPAFLPFNRGAHPNVWSIVEGTPAGVTLHFIDEGVDTGEIIAQRQLPVEPIDTGETLYRKLEQAAVQLFKENWSLIRSGKKTSGSIPQEKGSYHRTRDVEDIDRIELERTYKAKELINILRARTFPPYRGAYFIENGKRVYMQLHLDTSEEIGHLEYENDEK